MTKTKLTCDKCGKYVKGKMYQFVRKPGGTLRTRCYKHLKGKA